MTEIRERDFDAFFAAPFECYPKDSPYVSPLKSDLERYLSVDTNPLFERDDQFTYFTAHRDGKILGRIVAHVHAASNKLHGLNRACYRLSLYRKAVSDKPLGSVEEAIPHVAR